MSEFAFLMIVACLMSLAIGMLIGFLIGQGGSCDGDLILVGKVAMCR